MIGTVENQSVGSISSCSAQPDIHGESDKDADAVSPVFTIRCISPAFAVIQNKLLLLLLFMWVTLALLVILCHLAVA